MGETNVPPLEILRELNRVKVLFQQRAIAAIITQEPTMFGMKLSDLQASSFHPGDEA